MAFALDTELFTSATSATATITPAVTIPADRLLVVCINANDATAISANTDSGGSWTEALDAVPTSETAQVAIYWKITNASEPASYTFNLGSSRGHGIGYKAYTYASVPVQDNTPAVTRTGTTSVDLSIDAYTGLVVPANALAVAIGGKDNGNASGEAYTVADNSFGNVIGAVNSNRITALADRIYTTGETGAGALNIDTADGDDGVTDNSYGAIIVFTESGGATNGSTSLTGQSVAVARGILGATGGTGSRTIELTGVTRLALNTGVFQTFTGWEFEWYDKVTDTDGDPVDSGTFNATSGVASIPLTNSVLANGANGTLLITNPANREENGKYILPVTVT